MRLVDLGSLGDGELLVSAVVREFALDTDHAPDDTTALLAAPTHRPPNLIVLDNCEHLVRATAELVDAVLRSCPDVRVLATSRRPLGVSGECVRAVAPLPEADAVSLFVDRAILAGAEPADDPGVVDICRRVDGLPLAIERGCQSAPGDEHGGVADRLEDQLQFHRGAAEPSPRQGSLGDMVRWSDDLLVAATCQVFARLGVFASLLTLAGAEVVGADDRTAPKQVLGHVTALVDHSLLGREPGSRSATRYRLLETLRLFALDRLDESGAAADARHADADFYRRVADEAAPHLIGPDEVRSQSRLEIEEPNFDVALRWAADHDPEMALRLCVALWPYWSLRWNERRGVAYISAILYGSGLDVPEDLLAWALTAAGDMASNPGDARRLSPGQPMRSLHSDAPATSTGCRSHSSLSDRRSATGARPTRRTSHWSKRWTSPAGVATISSRRVPSTAHSTSPRAGKLELAAEISRSEIDAWVALGSARGEATALRRRAVRAAPLRTPRRGGGAVPSCPRYLGARRRRASVERSRTPHAGGRRPPAR